MFVPGYIRVRIVTTAAKDIIVCAMAGGSHKVIDIHLDSCVALFSPGDCHPLRARIPFKSTENGS